MEDEIQQVEVQIEHAKEVVALGDAIRRLEKNRDFQRVFGDVYMKEEATRLTLLTADPNLDEPQRANVLISLRAIGECFGFLRARKMQADLMAKELVEAEDVLDQMRLADAAGDNADGSNAE